jgi:hypothetical protein
VLHQHVGREVSDHDAIVTDLNGRFGFDRQSGLVQLVRQGFLVDGLREAWTQGGRLATYLDRLLSWLAESRAPADWSARLDKAGGRWRVRATLAPDAIGKSPARFAAEVFAATAAQARALVMEQTAPGIYEADLGSAGDSAAGVVVHRADDAAESVSLAVPGLPPREFETLGVDRARLEAIAATTGGQVQEDPDAFASLAARLQARETVPVGIYLVWAAGAVLLVQVALRLMGKA